MERLTRLDSNGCPSYIGEFRVHNDDVAAEMIPEAVREVLLKLSLYEISGLDPDGVAELKWYAERLEEKLHAAYQQVDGLRKAYERLNKFVATREALKPPRPIILQYPKDVTPCFACRKQKECDFHRMGMTCCCEGDPEVVVEDVNNGAT